MEVAFFVLYLSDYGFIGSAELMGIRPNEMKNLC
jgi:hypothetical protein